MLIFSVGYSQTANQWPLIFFLHGKSERGQDLNLVKNYGPPWIVEQRSQLFGRIGSYLCQYGLFIAKNTFQICGRCFCYIIL